MARGLEDKSRLAKEQAGFRHREECIGQVVGLGHGGAREQSCPHQKWNALVGASPTLRRVSGRDFQPLLKNKIK